METYRAKRLVHTDTVPLLDTYLMCFELTVAGSPVVAGLS